MNQPALQLRSRLSPEREAEIFEVTERLLREFGYEKLTMQEIAAQSRSSTATLYRRWNGKPRLVAEAVKHRRPLPVGGVDTGSLRGDLLAGTQPMAENAAAEQALIAALGHAAKSDAELARTLCEVLFAPALAALTEVLDRAVRRGEIDADIPARRYLHELLLAPMLVRHLTTALHPDKQYLIDYMDAVVLPALGVRKP